MSLDIVRRAVLTDIAYEIGGTGLFAFHKLLSAIRTRNWSYAAAEIKDSLLYKQVPMREQENIILMAAGQFSGGVTCAEDLIKKHEGCIFAAKPDAKGMWAIGYGHDIPPPPAGTVVTCTQEEADAYFKEDFALAVQRAETALGSEYW